jgi:PAS domain S-box-containing protein
MDTIFKKIFGKLIPGKSNDPTPSMREELLDANLRIGLGVGTILFVLMIIQDIQKRLFVTAIIIVFLYSWLALITFARQISYRVRIISWLVVLYLPAFIGLIVNGFGPDVGLYMLVVVGMTTMFFGFRTGLFSILVCAFTLIIMGFLVIRGVITPPVVRPQSDSVLWLVGLLTFTIMSLFLVISISTQSDHLKRSRNERAQAARDLSLALNEVKIKEEHFRSMIENSTDIITILDEHGTFMYVSPSNFSTVGYQPEELIGKNIADYMHPEDIESIREFLTPGNWSQEITSFEVRVRHKDGSWRNLEVRGKKTTSEDDTKRLILNCRDITEQKQGKEALSAADQLRQKAFANLNDAIFIIEPKLNTIIDCNQAACQIFGYTGEELIGSTTDFLHVDEASLDEFRNNLYPALKENGGLSHLEFRMKRNDGTVFPTDHSVIPLENSLGERTGWVGIIQDISTRKLAEKISLLELEQKKIDAEVALHQAESKFRHLFSGMMDAFFSSDMEGNILDFNEVFSKMLGYQPEELKGKTRLSLLVEKWHALETKVIHDEVLTRGYSDVYEKEMVRKDGDVFPVELRTFSYTNEQGERVGMWSIVRDISRRKGFESQLNRSEELYRTLAEASQDMIFIIDTQDHIQYVNSFAASSYGVKPGDMIGRPRSEFFGSSDGQRQEASLRKVFQTGQPFYTETYTLFPGGNVWLSTWIVPLKNPGGDITSMLGVSRDITDRKIIEEKLFTAQQSLEEKVSKRTRQLLVSQERLRSLSRKIITAQEDERHIISRELHDEAGQSLMSLKFSLDALKNETTVDQNLLRETLDQIVADIDQLMVQIRDLSHRLRPPLLDLGGINLCLKELFWEVRKNTNLEVKYTGEEIHNLPDDIAISLYRLVQEALVNVQKHSQATFVEVILQHNSGMISLSIEDNGQGMTRKKKKGIGLLGIEERLKLLGGTMRLSSREGKGLRLVASVPWTGSEK